MAALTWQDRSADGFGCMLLCRLPGPLGRYRAYYRLLTARGFSAYKRNELNAEKINNMTQHLNYEAVIQYAEIEDNDLLYFSYTNQASMELDHLHS